MLGSAFAGTDETPGDVVQKSVLLPESQKVVKVPFKVLRGMASIEAIKDRLDVEDADRRRFRRSAPKAWKSACRCADRRGPIIHDMIRHLCSSISYGGASSLAELKRCSGAIRSAI